MRYVPPVRKRVQLTTLDAEGAAVGMLDGTRVHVAGGCPGEEVEARIEHRSPHRPDAWPGLGPVRRLPDLAPGLRRASAMEDAIRARHAGAGGGRLRQIAAPPRLSQP